MVELDDAQTPLLMVHMKTFTPTPSAVIPVLACLGFEMIAEPETNVQVPVPMAGTLPFIVAKGEQVTWFAPASAVVGTASR